MRWGKYIIASIFLLLAVGNIPSVYLIVLGLLSGTANEPLYFIGKLLIYLILTIIYIFIALKLINWKK